MTKAEILSTAKPILFNTPMTQAVLEDRKNTTRRVVKGVTSNYRFLEMIENPSAVAVCSNGEEYPKEISGLYASFEGDDTAIVDFPLIKAPYRPGDLLYVRETWAEDYEYNGYEDKALYAYKADEGERVLTAHSKKWRPSIHMPKEAARIFLRVTDVRVERLQVVNFFDCIAEGIPYKQYEVEIINDFSELWDCTIKPADRDRYGWIANPWVWVIDFKRMEAST